ncbi:MAG: hypothetical protein IAE93_12920 [Ignavibacteria bacterium]|nr:hypothetical protein [Ignavibacteria bacterium]
MQKLSLTVTDIDAVGGELIPITDLIQTDFKFVKASDNVTEVTFSGFANNGNGNYMFWGFDVEVYNPPTETSQPQGIQVRIKINDVFQDGYGIFNVYADNDEPPSYSYSYGRVDRQGDTLFYWLTYVPDEEHEPPFDPYDPDSASDPDNVLVPRKWIEDNFGKLSGSNTGDKKWTGANEHSFTPIMATDATEYIVGVPSYDNSLVWKKWVYDNFAAISGNSVPINTNRLIVDSKQASNFTGKIYTTISSAISYAISQTPSASSRWEIFVMPHHSTGYSEDILLPRWCSVIGLGRVRILGSFDIVSPGSWTGYDAKIMNLEFQQSNESYTLRNLNVADCLFHANGASGEVNLLLNGCQFTNCGFICQNDVNIEITNPVKINRVVNCIGNIDLTWLGTDKVYSYNYITGDIWE